MVVAPAVLILVPMLLIAALVPLSMGRPVALGQWRPGLRGRAFIFVKFRIMANLYEPYGWSGPAV